jgi:hypothetical protein
MIIDHIMENFAMLVLVAILTESLTEIIKHAFNGIIKDKFTYLLSLVVGVVLAFAFDLNLFGLEGEHKYVSIVAAGLITSRGANYVNGFMKKFELLRGNK